MRNQPWEDKATDSAKELLGPFLGTDIAAGSIFEVVANKKDSGQPVYNENATPAEQTAQIANHLRKTLQPGIASNMERTWKAIKEERSSSGRKYDLSDEGMAWLGWRARTLEPDTALYYRAFDFSDKKRAATSTLSSTLRNINEIDNREIESAYESARRQLENAYREMSLIIGAAEKSGMSKQ
jgi:hypothetical protein